jgi:hypothetical protein
MVDWVFSGGDLNSEIHLRSEKCISGAVLFDQKPIFVQENLERDGRGQRMLGVTGNRSAFKAHRGVPPRKIVFSRCREIGPDEARRIAHGAQLMLNGIDAPRSKDAAEFDGAEDENAKGRH